MVLGDVDRTPHHLRALQLRHGRPAAQVRKSGGGFHLSRKTVEIPQRHFQKAGKHDFTEQFGVNPVFIVMVLQSLLRQRVFFVVNMFIIRNRVSLLARATLRRRPFECPQKEPFTHGDSG